MDANNLRKKKFHRYIMLQKNVLKYIKCYNNIQDKIHKLNVKHVNFNFN